jgi:FGGY-family pentulose kinase
MKKESDYFLSFDFGTESVRGAIFDERGKMLVTEAKAYSTSFPRAGWAEQRPGEWWDCFLEVAKNIVEKSGLPKGAVSCMAIDTTSCTVLALDGSHEPLRDAIIWMDVRSFEQAERIAATGMEPLKYNGFGSVSAEWMPCKALWLKENERDTYTAAEHICEFQDYINYRLTGEFVGSINNATARWYYNSREDGWPVAFYEKIGLGDVIEKFPPRILELGSPVGRIRTDLAAQIGLTDKTVVVQGGADAYIGVIGLGAVKPGRLAFITGSSHLMLGHTEHGFSKEGIFGAFPDCIMPGLYVVEGAQISSGSVLKWFRDGFVSAAHESEAKKRGMSLYDYFNSLAGEIRMGSEGLIVLNYWQGNRNPLIDSQARGVIWGLSLKHSPVHVYRAIMEGVSYGTEHIMRYFREAGFVAEEVFACGGATQSDLWMQIQSDVIGTPICLTEEPNAPLLGDAILASYGAGVYDSVEEAASNMVHIRSRIEPDLERTEEYRYYVDKYIETYAPLRDMMHDMLRHETG